MFSLGEWSPRIPTGFHVSRGTWEPGPGRPTVFAYGAITRSGGPFQILRLTVGLVTPRRVRSSSDPAPQRPTGNACGLSRRSSLGSSPFARRYLGNRGCFLVLEVLRCFSSLGWPPPPMDSAADTRALPRVGSPIRASADQCLLAASRGLSQLATPFIASWRQGIHRPPLVA
jgi:hypothetical protein